MNGNGMEKQRREEVAMVPKAGWGEKSTAWGDEDDVEFQEGECGVGSCKPGCLQLFSGIRTFTFVIGLATMLITGLRTYMYYNDIWLRRLYDLSHEQAGMMVSCLDIGFLVLVLFLSAVAKRWHVPRTLSVATAVIGIGAIIMFMPHAVHKSSITPIPNVTEENQITMDKLIFSAPTCTVNPKMQEKMMMMMSSGGGASDDPECNTGAAAASSGGSKPDQSGKTDNTDTVVDSGKSGPVYNNATKTSTPAPSDGGSGTGEPNTTELPIPMKTIEVPDFALLSQHPSFPAIAQAAMAMYKVDLNALAKLNREDQLKALIKVMPNDPAKQMSSLKGLLGADAPKYFYTTQVPASMVGGGDNSRRKRQAETGNVEAAEADQENKMMPTSVEPSTEDKMLAKLKTDMMWTGQLANLVRTAYADLFTNPCTQKKIRKMAEEMCPFNTEPFFEDTEGAATLFVVLVSMGMIIVGLGKAAYPAFLAMYVNNRTSESGIGMYIGIIFMCAVLGPFLGFILFGATSSTYITLEDPGLMSYVHPRWLAAWWVGPLIVGVVCLVLAIPLFFFPNVKDRRSKSASVKGVSRITKGFFQGLLRLVCNPIFLLITLGNAVTMMTTEGMLATLPKFVEKHFSLNIEVGYGVGLLMGALLILGTVVGGVVVSWAKLSPFSCLKLVAGCTLVMVILQASSLGLGCDQPDLNKGDMIVNDTVSKQPMACSQTCVCMDFIYMPVCGSDGVSYFSPCHAGCGHPLNKEWHHCKCIGDDVRTAKPGLCEMDCQKGKFYGYNVVLGVTCLLLAISAVPAFLSTLRCVEGQDSHLAIGFNAFIITLAGIIPGPMIYYTIFDNNCLMERPSCGPLDLCAIYDVNALGMHFNGLNAGLRALAAVFYVVAMVLGLRGGSVFSESVYESNRRK